MRDKILYEEKKENDYLDSISDALVKVKPLLSI